MTRREIAFVAITTALGAVLRVFQIGAQSLWLDELYSVAVSRRDWIGVLIGSAQGDTNPPLFNLLLHLALQFGTDENAARSVSLLFSVATIPLCYTLARQLFDARVAAIATFILILNPLHIFYAQEARMYTMLTFFVLGASYFFLRAWCGGGRLAWIGFGIFQVLAFYTHSLAFLNLLALDLFALVSRNKMRAQLRELIIAHVFILVAFVPWMIVFAQQAARVQAGFWAGLPSHMVFLTTPYFFLFSSVVPSFFFPVALFVTLAILVFLVIASVRTILHQTDGYQAVQFSIIILFVPMGALYVLSFLRPIYVERTLLPSSIGLYLLLAWVIARANPRQLIITLAAIVLLTTLLALTNYYFNPDVQKPPMGDVARVLASQARPGDVIAHTSDSSALAFAYYTPDLPSHFLAGDPDYTSDTTRGQTGRVAGLVPEDLSLIASQYTRLWLVVALDHNVEYQKARVAEMDTKFSRLSSQTIGGMYLILFQIGSQNGS